MKTISNQFSRGEKVKVFFQDSKEPQFFFIYRVFDDAIILTEPSLVLASLSQKTNQLVIANSINIKGVKFTPKDKVTLITKTGKSIELFIDSFINRDSLVLTTKLNNPKPLKWLFDLLKGKMV